MKAGQAEPLICYWDPCGISVSGSGIAHYGACLRQGLDKLGSTVLLGSRDQNIFYSRIKVLQGQRNYLSLLRARGARSTAPFIYHGLANINLPLWQHRRQDKMVVTIHDIIPLLEPSAVSRSYFEQFRWALPRVLKIAEQVIVISRWSREQVRERYPWSAEKLRLIPHGLDGLGKVSQQEVSRDSKRTVLLAVSRFEHYKRFPLLIELLRALGRDYLLQVVCDARGLRFLHREAGDLLGEGRLEVFCQISQLALAQIYQKADLLLLPSWYEGFCLPAAEGLAAGVPLLYQRGTAVEEFVPASLGVGIGERSDSIEPWVAAVRKLRGFKRQEDFQKQLGIYLAGRRSWDDVARETREVYCSLVPDFL